MTQYPCIHNAPLPADGPGNFPTIGMFAALVCVPLWLSWKTGGGIFLGFFYAIFTTLPILAVVWLGASAMSPRKNEKARYPGRGVQHYLTFHKETDKARYTGSNKIQMEEFYERFFNGDVEFNGDCLEIMEYRHDWANFRFNMSLLLYVISNLVPEAIMHTRSQGKSFGCMT